MKAKHLLLLGFLSLFTSCAPSINKINGNTKYYLIDFREYTKKGFYLSPVNTTKPFTPIGLVQVNLTQSAKLKTIRNGNDLNGEPKFYKSWVKDTVNIQTAIDSLVNLAKSINANGIINFESSIRYDYPLDKMNNTNKGPSILIVEVSGFAVKIEDE
mgnify:CR=1 FL=1